MGRQHLTGIVLPDGSRRPGVRVRQVKTGHEIPFRCTLSWPARWRTYRRINSPNLLTSFGKPFSPRGFYNPFRDWYNIAGVPPGRSPHGLRKRCGRRLAEAGTTAPRIMSVLGLRTLAFAEVATRAAARARIAAEGMGRIGNMTSNPAKNGRITTIF
jgi:integrase